MPDIDNRHANPLLKPQTSYQDQGDGQADLFRRLVEQLQQSQEPTTRGGNPLGWAPPDQPLDPKTGEAIAQLLAQGSQSHAMLQGAGRDPRELEMLARFLANAKSAFESKDYHAAGLDASKAATLGQVLLKQHSQ